MQKTKSAILAAVHDTARGLHNAGVMDQVTLREFDRSAGAGLRARFAHHRAHADEPGVTQEKLKARLRGTAAA